MCFRAFPGAPWQASTTQDILLHEAQKQFKPAATTGLLHADEEAVSIGGGRVDNHPRLPSAGNPKFACPGKTSKPPRNQIHEVLKSLYPILVGLPH